jgi:copper chaperone CopZ
VAGTVDLERKRSSVTYDPAEVDLASISAAVEAAGYPVAGP